LELIRFQDGAIAQAISLQLGAVRLTERFVADRALPITDGVRTAIESHVQQTVGQSGFDFQPSGLPMVVTGGAFVIARVMLARQQGLDLAGSSPILNAVDLRALEAELSVMPLIDRIHVPDLPPARADIVPTALVTIIKVLEMAGRDAVTHSFYNLRYGLAAELLSDE
jgi:exopolyphosphatase/guanosine-5'-triphosphate,3'-diphosphate pyrophosphatase